MTTPPPSPEAVEAARIYARNRKTWESMSENHLNALTQLLGEDDGFDVVCIGILAAEVERLREQVDAVCEWQYDDHDCKWDSNCGEAWQFMDGDPDENNVRYCQGCGRKVKITTNENEQP